MSKNRRNHAPAFKAKVSLEALREELTTNEIAAKFKIHPTQVTAWKKQLREQARRSSAARLTPMKIVKRTATRCWPPSAS